MFLCAKSNVTSKRSLSHGKLIIPRHPIGSLNASVSGLIVSVYTSIGEPASSNSVGRSNHSI
nr:MAG TPA: hypothetical protein [Bacteriophage sp.]